MNIGDRITNIKDWFDHDDNNYERLTKSGSVGIISDYIVEGVYCVDFENGASFIIYSMDSDYELVAE